MTAFGLYVHIPFCPQLCPYCAFASLQGKEEFYERYVAAVCRELDRCRHLEGRKPLGTVFFGGGTPSMLEPGHLRRILEAATVRLGLAVDAEITIEVNPGTTDYTKFSTFRALGFNRLSIGVQSFTDQSLRALGRVHSAREAEEAYAVARKAGFDNVNLDLISSIPDMPPEHWRHSLERALELAPEHISTYALTIEEGTLFAERQRQGRLQPVSEEEDTWAYEWAMKRLRGAGYEHYEVSNFALPGRRSRHNWGYWSGAEYLGVGLSAHSFLNARRSWNARDLLEYIEAVEAGRSPCAGAEEIDAATARRERVWMGLRTQEGVLIEPGERLALEREERFRGLQEAGYVEFEGIHLRLAGKGFMVADALGVELMDLLEEVSDFEPGTYQRKIENEN